MKPFPTPEPDQYSEAAEIAAHNAARDRFILRAFGFTIAFTLIAAGALGGIMAGVVFSIGLVLTSKLAPAYRLSTEAELARRHHAAQRGSSRGGDLIAVGVLLLFIGLSIGALALMAETTVGSTVNLGLMHAQTIKVIIAGFASLGGLLMIGIGAARR